ncbi:dihydrofolate reductase [Rhizobium leguminosarum bv. trifolii WSM597]|uniref:Dihydrofolate reductase n=1 Tax=Rhizobium leguminosarum bv. trifolii WSM597 TaxID=754764 RepID=I9NGH9_RHILT|nr:dihydrofolate reductase family protein [Rhizobium leguminosarum]EJB07059.1 dihydrofolate reductase [Rhizobium leguminosarum bv. trifolii WSM597]
MTKVVFNISMSLDGFITAGNQTKEEPLGKNSEFLHEWFFNNGAEGDAYVQRLTSNVGSAICGRKCYDDSIPYWDENGPTGPLKLSLFVVTHRPLLASHSTGIYHAAGTITDAVKQAKSAARGKDVSLMGGADVFRQALAGGLVDEIELHIVPVLFGAGTRLFDTLPNQIKLEPTSMLDTPLARHIAYRIVK